MLLWNEWLKWVVPLMEACSRGPAGYWMLTVIAGFCTREDHLGVTSFVRTLRLRPESYRSMLHLFDSDALDIDKLTRCWTRTVFRLHQGLLRFNGMYVLVADIIKIPKEGLKMPARKCHHQESSSNSKPEHIMGHLCQSVGILAGKFGEVAFIPFVSRIHEGVKLEKLDKRTHLDKLVEMLDSLRMQYPFVLVADAYYGAGKVAVALVERDGHLLTRCRRNGVAYELPEPKEKKGRGRPRKYGNKMHLRTLFDMPMLTAQCPLYGESRKIIEYCCVDMMWRPAGILVRFVAVRFPPDRSSKADDCSQRGDVVFMCTDTSMEPLDIVRLYGYRYKIEVSFKHGVHVVGVWAYRFWMRAMDAVKKGSGTQQLEGRSEEYRESAMRTMRKYHRHIQLGVIAQGVLVALATTVPELVHRYFRSWFRTMPEGTTLPSELYTSFALRGTFFEFLSDCSPGRNPAKFIRKNLDPERGKSDFWAA